jgi:hypothetical protein
MTILLLLFVLVIGYLMYVALTDRNELEDL